MAVPLHIKNKVIGVIEVINKSAARCLQVGFKYSLRSQTTFP